MKSTTRRIALGFAMILALSAMGVGAAQAAIRYVPADYATIQSAITASVAGDIVSVAAGIYKESNILVDKALTIQGVGATRDDVVVAPAAEDGNVDSAFATNAQNGFVIKAHDVTIQNLTINGRGNPLLTVGKNNFRTGIVTLDASQTGGGAWNNLHVNNVVVKYAYRRGISVNTAVSGYSPQTASGTVVENSRVEYIAFNHGMYLGGQSQAINNTVKHAFQGIVLGLDTSTPAGLIKANGNTLTEIGNFTGCWGDQGAGVYGGQPRAIQFNNSDSAGRAVEIRNNVIDDIGSAGTIGTVGIYTRLADASSIVDNNTIVLTSGRANSANDAPSVGMLLGWSYANGFTASNNQVSSSGYGMGVMIFGNGTLAKPMVMEGNTITATNSTRLSSGDGTGIYIANQYLFGDPANPDKNESYVILRSGNAISGFVRGIDVEKVITSTQPLTVTANGNSIAGNTTGIDASTMTAAIDATCNWWGAATGPGPVGTGSGDRVSNFVTFSPWSTSSGGACNGSTPPLVTVPSNMVVVATSASGAVVNFAASAFDDLDGALPVSCTPASGQIFPLGLTTVTCSTTDSSNNVGASSFAVWVEGPVTPAGIWAQAGNGSATVNFSKPWTPDGTTISSYTLTISPNAPSGSSTVTITPSGSSTEQYTWTGLANDTNYTFTVQATNSNGVSSPLSSSSNIVTPAELLAPVTPSIWSQAGDGNATVNFSAPWTPDGTTITGYTVTVSPAIGRIAYHTNQSGNYDIWVMDAQGGSKTRLTSSTANETQPKWSKNGQKIVYASDYNASGGNNIWAMNSDGTGKVQLTTTNAANNPIWTPDGTKILYSTRTVDQSDIYIMDAIGTNQKRLTTTVGGWTGRDGIGISPDGTKITYTSPPSGTNNDLFSATLTCSGNASTCAISNVQQINSDSQVDTYPSFTPDGKILWSSGREIYSINTDGSGVVQITTNAATSDVQPVSSPDGNKIIFSSDRASGSANKDLWVVGSDGMNLTQLTNTAAYDEGGADWWGTTTVTGTGSPITVTGLTNGTTYTFTVTATNSAGKTSPSSLASSVTPMALVPAMPAGIWAQAGDGSATVNFSTPWTPEGTTITGYVLTRDPDGSTVTIGASGSATEQYTWTGLTNGTTYTFTAKATNNRGTGPETAPSNSVTPTAPVPPVTPAGIWAQAGDANATVNFSRPWTPDGTTITGYTVTITPIDPSGSSSSTTITPSGSPTEQYTWPGLTNGNSYQFTVKATNNRGTSSPESSSNIVTPAALVPTMPAGIWAQAGDASATVNFSRPWTPDGTTLTGYVLTRVPDGSTVTITPSGSATEQYTWTGLTNGTTYTFTAKATNNRGTGPETAPSNSVMPTVPVSVTPAGIWAQAGDENATVHFSRPWTPDGTTISYYTVTISSGGSPVTITPSGAATEQYTWMGLTNGNAYYFTVTATNNRGAISPASDSNLVSPTALVPAMPAGIWAQAGDKNATINFTAPWTPDGTTITSYTVTMSSPSGSTITITPSGSSTEQYTWTGLTNGTTYTFTVKAINSRGASIGADVSVTPTALIPAAPVGIWGQAGDTTATINFGTPWTPEGTMITQYTIVVSPVDPAGHSSITMSASGAATEQYTWTGLTNNTRYTFTVRAINNLGGTSPGASVSVIPSWQW